MDMNITIVHMIHLGVIVFFLTRGEWCFGSLFMAKILISVIEAEFSLVAFASTGTTNERSSMTTGMMHVVGFSTVPTSPLLVFTACGYILPHLPWLAVIFTIVVSGRASNMILSGWASPGSPVLMIINSRHWSSFHIVVTVNGKVIPVGRGPLLASETWSTVGWSMSHFAGSAYIMVMRWQDIKVKIFGKFISSSICQMQPIL